ncbi:MAG: hypothetical protein AAF828_10770, partial [Bacteroidota bacterium]
QVVTAVGGLDALYQLEDMAYTYNTSQGSKEERYIIDGEFSAGRSTTKDGKIKVEYYDGQNAYVYLDGKLVKNEDMVASAFFARKTNFYWILMMHKLLDPGLIYRYGGTRTVEGVAYEIVDMTFEDGVGVAKDRYVLYINPYTHLVDQFLFNVMAVGREDPIMMKFTYDTFPGGVKFPVLRQSTAALNWEGDIAKDAKWGVRWFTDFSFNNGFTQENLRKF